MAMHHPHPGEFISGVYLEPNGISGHELAEKLDVAASTLSRILKAPAASPRKWRFACPRRLAARPKAGWRCRMRTTCGWHGSTSICSA